MKSNRKTEKLPTWERYITYQIQRFRNNMRIPCHNKDVFKYLQRRNLKPAKYYVHIPKSQRRGLTYAQMQAIRGNG